MNMDEYSYDDNDNADDNDTEEKEDDDSSDVENDVDDEDEDKSPSRLKHRDRVVRKRRLRRLKKIVTLQWLANWQNICSCKKV